MQDCLGFGLCTPCVLNIVHCWCMAVWEPAFVGSLSPTRYALMMASFFFPLPCMIVMVHLPNPDSSFLVLQQLVHFPRVIEHVPPGWYQVFALQSDDEVTIFMWFHVRFAWLYIMFLGTGSLK